MTLPVPLALDYDLSPYELCVYMALLQLCEGGSECSPSMKELAVDARCSVSKVQRSLRVLADRGYVEIIGQYEHWTCGGGRANNLYRLIDVPPVEDTGHGSPYHCEGCERAVRSAAARGLF